MIQIPGTIVCAGNLTEDIVVWPVDEVVFGTTTWVTDVVTSFGGNGANTSFAIARLGGAVRLIGLVGGDEAGEQIVRQLRAGGVDVRVGRSDLPTPVTVAIVRSDAARSFLHRPGASRQAFTEPLAFPPDLIDGCSHFHLANPFAMPEMRKQAGDVLKRARAAGLTTSLDTGWDALGQWMDVIGPCLPYLDLLLMNEDEAEKLSGLRDPKQAAAFFERKGVGSTVVKLGVQGCAIFDGGEEHRIAGFPVTALDTTGAGDCFVGAFLAALQRFGTAAEAGRFANAAGALSVQHPGGTTGLLDYAETLSWMENQGQPRP